MLTTCKPNIHPDLPDEFSTVLKVYKERLTVDHITDKAKQITRHLIQLDVLK